MESVLRSSQILNLLRSLRVAQSLGTYGVSQLVVLAAGLVRIPLVAGSCSKQVLSGWLFWVTTMSWASLLAAAPTNVARVHTNAHATLKAASTPERVLGLVFAAFSLTFIPLALGTGAGWLAGGIPICAYFFITVSTARHTGYVYARDAVQKQFLATALGACVGTVLTFVVTQWGSWHGISDTLQVFILSSISGLTASSAAFLARSQSRGVPESLTSTADNPQVSFLRETASVLPPALLSGFDSLSLLVSGRMEEVAFYGVMSRLMLAVAFVPAASYVQVNNFMQRRQEQERPDLKIICIATTLLNSPFVVLFVGFAPLLVPLLSQQTLEADLKCIVVIAGIGLLLPVWIVVSASISANEVLRSKMGAQVLRVVLPLSVISTFALSRQFGVSGTFSATLVTYLAAIATGLRILFSQKRIAEVE